MDQQQLLAMIQYLGKLGVPSADIVAMFGSQFGLDPQQGPDTNALFQQYMPTFGQINTSDSPNSLRQSIAKEVMSNTPIWQIQQGIADAVTKGDPGVEPGQTVADYVSLAKTLQSEFQSFNTQMTNAQKDNPYRKWGITATPDQQYTPEQLFPDVMAKLGEFGQKNPLYTMGAVGSGADMPKPGDVISSTKTTTDVSNTSQYKSAKKVLDDAIKSGSLNATFDGKTYSIGELRDSIVPMFKKRAGEEKSANEKVLQTWKDEAKRLGMSEGGPRVISSRDPEQRLNKTENFGVPQSDAKWEKAQRDFKNGVIDEKQFIAEKNNRNNFMENLGRMKGMVAQVSAQQEGWRKAKPTFDTKTTTSTVNTTVQPGQYIGPKGGESTMARTWNPLAFDVNRGVKQGLQTKINQSGRTPMMDQLMALAQQLANPPKGK